MGVRSAGKSAVDRRNVLSYFFRSPETAGFGLPTAFIRRFKLACLKLDRRRCATVRVRTFGF